MFYTIPEAIIIHHNWVIPYECSRIKELNHHTFSIEKMKNVVDQIKKWRVHKYNKKADEHLAESGLGSMNKSS